MQGLAPVDRRDGVPCKAPLAPCTALQETTALHDSTAVHCVVQCTAKKFSVLKCTGQHYYIYYTIIYCSTPHCTAQHYYTILYYNLLFHTTLHCTALHWPVLRTPPHQSQSPVPPLSASPTQLLSVSHPLETYSAAVQCSTVLYCTAVQQCSKVLYCSAAVQ